MYWATAEDKFVNVTSLLTTTVLPKRDFDISVSMLQKIARRYGVSLDALMFGEEPKMSSYFLTRAGKGVSIERTKAYKYQASLLVSWTAA